MRKTLTWIDLTSIGVGGIIGAGIYVLTGQAAARYAGPAISLSFIIAAFSCLFSALCYSELSSMIPVSGSAYSFASFTLGQLVGWMIGWDLIIEYLFGASTVAVGWSGYFCSLLKDLGMPLPQALSLAPYARHSNGEGWVATGGVFNAPAVAIVGLMTWMLYRGVQESAKFNNIVVVVKVLVLVLFLLAGWGYTKPENWSPFVPPAQGSAYGAWGVLRGSSVVFFSYIGFDAISTASGEAKDPQSAIPVATLLSLAICTVLYVLVGFTITGLVHYTELDVPDPIAVAVDAAGAGLMWLRPIIKIGALLGLTSVIMVLIMGQARIFWAMAEDGLLPPYFATLHPTHRSPSVTTVITGVLAAIIAGLLPVDVLGEMVSIGTLAAFAVVCAGVIALRKSRPDIPRPFRVPYSPYVPALGVATSLVQIFALPPETWLRLLLWMGIGLVIYHGYSKAHAKPMEERMKAMFGGEGGSAAAATIVAALAGGGGPPQLQAPDAGSPAEASPEGGSTPLISASVAVDSGSIGTVQLQ